MSEYTLIEMVYSPTKGKRVAKADRTVYKTVETGKVFVSAKAIGRAAWLCAMADGAECLHMKDRLYVNGDWCKQYADEIKDVELREAIESVERKFAEEEVKKV